MSLIEKAKARMAELMRDGVTLTFLYPAGRAVRLTSHRLLEEAVDKCSHAQLVRLLSSGDHAEAGRMMAQALAMAIDETCEDEVSEWLAHQAQQEKEAAA